MEVEIRRLQEEIAKIQDPRRDGGNKRHKLEDIIVIGLCSVMSCGEDFVDMEEFGKDREEWLRGFLELPNGIPDSDTFRRVFERLDSVALAESLNAWLDRGGSSGGRSVAIDGKTICGSKNATHKAYHVVSAWVTENEITLGEIAVEEKSNEITAIPELLDLIDIEGDVVSIDAMGCQREIAQKILEKKADYVLALKENQPDLHEAVYTYFDWLEKEKPSDAAYDLWTSGIEKSHGRIERREIALARADWLEQKDAWAGLSCIVRCRSIREVGAERTISDRYYISSFDTSAANFAQLIRGHWSIENQLHWMLDVVFREDAARARKNHSPLNLNVLRKIALSLLKKLPFGRLSVHKKMLKASRDPAFLSTLLFQF